MSWFDGIKENTLVLIELDSGEKLECNFLNVVNSIVSCKVNDKIKKFRENRIESVEEIEKSSKNNFNEIEIQSSDIMNEILELIDRDLTKAKALFVIHKEKFSNNDIKKIKNTYDKRIASIGEKLKAPNKNPSVNRQEKNNIESEKHIIKAGKYYIAREWKKALLEFDKAFELDHFPLNKVLAYMEAAYSAEDSKKLAQLLDIYGSHPNLKSKYHTLEGYKSKLAKLNGLLNKNLPKNTIIVKNENLTINQLNKQELLLKEAGALTSQHQKPWEEIYKKYEQAFEIGFLPPKKNLAFMQAAIGAKKYSRALEVIDLVLQNNNLTNEDKFALLHYKLEAYKALNEIGTLIETYQAQIDLCQPDTTKYFHAMMGLAYVLNKSNRNQDALYYLNILLQNITDPKSIDTVSRRIEAINNEILLNPSEEPSTNTYLDLVNDSDMALWLEDVNENESFQISELLKKDMDSLTFRDETVLRKGGNPSYEDALRILDSSKTLNIYDFVKYPLQLEAAKALYMTALDDETQYYKALYDYAKNKGISYYEQMRQIELNDLSDEYIMRLRDNASTYFLEAMNLRYKMNSMFVYDLLAFYIKAHILCEATISKKILVLDEKLFGLQTTFAKILRFCLDSGDESFEKIALTAFITCGSSNIGMWNQITRDSWKNEEIKRFIKNIIKNKQKLYPIIAQIESIDYDLAWEPRDFFKEIFEKRNIKNQSLKETFLQLQKKQLDPIYSTDLNETLKTIELNYKNILTNTEIEVVIKLQNITKMLSNYFKRSSEEKSKILSTIRSILLEQSEFIQSNTTYWGRIGIEPILSKWERDVDIINLKRLSEIAPEIIIKPDPYKIQIHEKDHYINLLVRNTGKATCERIDIEYSLFSFDQSHLYDNGKLTISDEISVNDYSIEKIYLTHFPSNNIIPSFVLEVKATVFYESKPLQILEFNFTLSLSETSHMTYQTIPWKESGLPGKQQFLGRNDLIDKLIFHYTSANRDTSYVLYGLTRTGKSSILKYFGESMKDTIIKIDDKEYKYISFYWTLDKASNNASGGNNFNLWRYFVEETILEELKKDTSFQNIELPSNSEQYSFLDLENILKFLKNIGYFPIILIDELSYYKLMIESNKLDSSFLAAIRSMALENQSSFIFAGTYDVKDLITDSKYGMTGQFVTLKSIQISKIEKKHAIELINIAQENLTFSDDAIEHILKLSNQIPYFIQIICKNCALFAIEMDIKYIGYGEVEDAIKMITGENINHDSDLQKLDKNIFDNNQINNYNSIETEVLISSIAYLNMENGKIKSKQRSIEYEEIKKLWKDHQIPNYAKRLAEASERLLQQEIILEDQQAEKTSYVLSVDLFRRWWTVGHKNISVQLDKLM